MENPFSIEIGDGPSWRPPTFETARLVLRPLRLDDAPAVFAYASDPKVCRHTLFNRHESILDSEHFVGKYAPASYAEKQPEPLGIVWKETGNLIGTCGCFWSSKPNGVMELGYALSEPFWGKGIIVEAATAVIDHVFTGYDCERLQARVLDGNAASGRVLEKLGFTLEGTLRHALFVRSVHRDVTVYSLLRTERILAA